MAYWDYQSGTTTYWNTSPSGYLGNGTYPTTSFSTNSSSTWVRVVTVTSYIVSGFDDWDEGQRADLTRLINDETTTGFTIQCWIEGEVKITDPNVREVDVEQFRQLLMMHARGEDRQRISHFFENRAPKPAA